MKKPYVKPQNIFTFDIESGATEPDAVIISISVMHDKLNDDGIHYVRQKPYHTMINYEHYNGHGRVFSQSTLDWWFNDIRSQFNPSREVINFTRDVCGTVGNDLLTGLLGMAKYLVNAANGDRSAVYIANGPDFDMIILQHALSQYTINYAFPHFAFRNIRNIRETIGALDLEPATLREADFKIEYAEPGYYTDCKYVIEGERREHVRDPKFGLPVKEPHSSMYDADIEAMDARTVYEFYNRQVERK